MVILQDMTEVEFDSYRLIFINEYASDLADSRKYSIEEAQERAAKVIDAVSLQSADKPENRFFSILRSDTEKPVIGYLWIEITKKSAWILDFWLLPDWRMRGFGRAALEEMEVALARMGVNEVGLRVAPNNPAAKALYEKVGFRITGFNMHRALS